MGDRAAVGDPAGPVGRQGGGRGAVVDGTAQQAHGDGLREVEFHAPAAVGGLARGEAAEGQAVRPWGSGLAGDEFVLHDAVHGDGLGAGREAQFHGAGVGGEAEPDARRPFGRAPDAVRGEEGIFVHRDAPGLDVSVAPLQGHRAAEEGVVEGKRSHPRDTSRRGWGRPSALRCRAIRRTVPGSAWGGWAGQKSSRFVQSLGPQGRGGAPRSWEAIC